MATQSVMVAALIAASGFVASVAAQRSTAPGEVCAGLVQLPMIHYDLRLVLSPVGHPWPFSQSGADAVLTRIAARLPARDALELQPLAVAAWEVLEGRLVPALQSEVAVTLWRDGSFSEARVVVTGLLPQLTDALAQAVAAAGPAGDLRSEYWVAQSDSVYLRLLLRLEPRNGVATRSLGALVAPVASESKEATFRAAKPFTLAAVQFVDPVVTLIIGANGRPERESVRVIGAAHRRVERHVTSVVRSWRFQPATVAGCAVRESFTFHLSSVWHHN